MSWNNMAKAKKGNVIGYQELPDTEDAFAKLIAKPGVKYGVAGKPGKFDNPIKKPAKSKK